MKLLSWTPPSILLAATAIGALAGAPALAPAPASAELAALIPREALLGNPVKTNPQISPDGQTLAYLAPSPDGVMNIWVQTLGKDDAKLASRDTHRGIGTYQWAHDGRHILYIQDKDGDENWHLYATDLHSGSTRDLTPYPGAAADAILTDRNHPDEVLVSLNKRDPTTFDMYRVKLSTGELTLEVENPGDVTEWATDSDFHIRAAVALDGQTSDTILRVRAGPGQPWRDLLRWEFWEAGDVLYKKILGFTRDGKLIVQSPMGSDMTRLVLLDAQTGAEIREIAADRRSDVWNVFWVPQVVQDPVTYEIQAVGFDYLVPEWRVVDPKITADFEALRKLTPGMFTIDSRDHADQRWIVGTYTDTQPAVFYLYDRTTRKAELLFESMPQLSGYALAPTRQVTYTARDGLAIPAYLTLPVGVEGKNLPLIMHPHGGPWHRDDWGFDAWVQLFANRGYAVLQPNFRGSVGYGKTFINRSTREWGVGAMQHDLTDGVKWAVDQGIADPKRVAIMGGSYGGYATLAGAAFTPELYACAVDLVGPSNVATLFASMPPYWKVRKLRWIKRVGDVENDDALNRRISPLFHADQIRAPLLIGHGANDPRVKLAESDAIVAAARKHGLPVTFVVYPDEGHGFARPENNLDFMGRVEEFLAKYLGGRCEPWRPVKGSTAEVR
jgi:dipeptidyl aminopeptidase/acylaminoacyl peptidase